MQSGKISFQQSLIGKATGLLALAATIFFLARDWRDPLTAIACLFFIVICLTDTLYAKILNSSNLLMCMGGLTFQIFSHGIAGLYLATLGLLTGLALLLIPYWMGGVGGGDVKALAALGTLVGPMTILQVFLYIGLIGGVIALKPGEIKSRLFGWMTVLLALVCTKKPGLFIPVDPQKKLRFPYAAAIALGFFAFTTWGGIL
ncbi:prepilin peptidase [Thermodesulfobacteriota bacterium]